MIRTEGSQLLSLTGNRPGILAIVFNAFIVQHKILICKVVDNNVGPMKHKDV